MMGYFGLAEYFTRVDEREREKDYDQFLDVNDLALVIPKILRDMPQETPEEKTEKKKQILKFLTNCAINYKELRMHWWAEWVATKQTAGRRKRRRTKNKQNKSNKSNKQNKKRKTKRRN
jgi:hypothetical protein